MVNKITEWIFEIISFLIVCVLGFGAGADKDWRWIPTIAIVIFLLTQAKVAKATNKRSGYGK